MMPKFNYGEAVVVVPVQANTLKRVLEHEEAALELSGVETTSTRLIVRDGSSIPELIAAFGRARDAVMEASAARTGKGRRASPKDFDSVIAILDAHRDAEVQEWTKAAEPVGTEAAEAV